MDHAKTNRQSSAALVSDARRREQDALHRARTGDPAAFGTLVDLYTPRIYHHLWRLMRQRQEAEDLTQETFLRAFRYLARYDPERSFQTWLYTIATNLGLNALRSRKRRGYAVSLDADYDDGVDTVSPMNLTANEPDGRTAALREEAKNEVLAAVERLPQRDAMLVHLHYKEGMSLREAGEIVGLREGAAKVALFRARKKLREWLVGDMSNELS